MVLVTAEIENWHNLLVFLRHFFQQTLIAQFLHNRQHAGSRGEWWALGLLSCRSNRRVGGRLFSCCEKLGGSGIIKLSHGFLSTSPHTSSSVMSAAMAASPTLLRWNICDSIIWLWPSRHLLRTNCVPVILPSSLSIFTCWIIIPTLWHGYCC